VQNAQVVGELDVTFAEIEGDRVLLGGIMYGIQSFRLGLGQCRYPAGPLAIHVSRQVTTGVLDNESLWVIFRGGLIVQQWA